MSFRKISWLLGLLSIGAVFWLLKPGHTPTSISDQREPPPSPTRAQATFRPSTKGLLETHDPTHEADASKQRATLDLGTRAKRSSPQRSTTLEVRVLSEMGQRPIEGVDVRLRGVSPPGPTEEGITDLNGVVRFQIEAETFSQYRLDGRKSGFQLTATTFGLNSAIPLIRKTLIMPNVVTVYGLVQNQDGADVPDARVTLVPVDNRGRRSAAFSQQDGSFRMQTAPGTYLINLRKNPHPAPIDQEISIAAGQDLELGLRLEETETVLLTGRVLDSEFQPIAGALITIQSRKEERLETATPNDRPRRRAAQGRIGPASRDSQNLTWNHETDGRGAFRVELLPAVPALLQITAPGYGDLDKRVSINRDQSRDFHLRAFETFEVELLDPLGTRIDSFSLEGRNGAGQETVKGAGTGRYYSRDYPIWIRAGVGSGISETVYLPKHQALVRLTLGVSPLTGLVLGPSGDPVRSFRLDLKYESRPESRFSNTVRLNSEDGSFRLENLVEGPASIMISTSRGNSTERRVRLTSGKETFVEFKLPE